MHLWAKHERTVYPSATVTTRASQYLAVRSLALEPANQVWRHNLALCPLSATDLKKVKLQVLHPSAVGTNKFEQAAAVAKSILASP